MRLVPSEVLSVHVLLPMDCTTESHDVEAGDEAVPALQDPDIPSWVALSHKPYQPSHPLIDSSSILRACDTDNVSLALKGVAVSILLTWITASPSLGSGANKSSRWAMFDVYKTRLTFLSALIAGALMPG